MDRTLEQETINHVKTHESEYTTRVWLKMFHHPRFWDSATLLHIMADVLEVDLYCYLDSGRVIRFVPHGAREETTDPDVPS